MCFIAPDAVFPFYLAFKHHLVLIYVPFGSTGAFSASIYLFYGSYIVGNYEHVQSQGGRQPAAAKLPSYVKYMTRKTQRIEVAAPGSMP